MYYHKDFKSIVIWWNNLFVLDRWWREKHNIPFNSSLHRSTSQIDIYYEWIEEKTLTAHFKQKEKELKEEKDFKNGIYIKEQIEEDFDLDKLDFSQINLNNGQNS